MTTFRRLANDPDSLLYAVACAVVVTWGHNMYAYTALLGQGMAS